MIPSERSGFRVLIVEDEERARRTLRQLLLEEPDMGLVGETSGPEAVTDIRELRPDLVFLDVQMPEMNGFEVLSALEPSEIPVVVFVTAYEEYALKAFEVAAVDYLLKPFSDTRFRSALDRVRETLRSADLSRVRSRVEKILEIVDAQGPSDSEMSSVTARLVFRDATRTYVLRPTEIDWVEARGAYVRIHIGATSLLLRESLTEVARRLEPHGFYRIHRSTIVRIDRIAELRHDSHGDYQVRLTDGTKLKLTRTRKDGLEQRLGDRIR